MKVRVIPREFSCLTPFWCLWFWSRPFLMLTLRILKTTFMTSFTLPKDEWKELFRRDSQSLIDTERIRVLCFKGGLQGSHFRSFAWRILLGCLSPDIRTWNSTLKQKRQEYAALKKEMLANDQLYDKTIDPALNNPLSQQDESPWTQYFYDVELRGCIEQDVERTFPELEYFKSPKVRKLMVTILFVYGRQHPHVAYKQGMHEILGPLLFVLFFDQEALAHASEQDQLKSIDTGTLLEDVVNPEYLEHDAFDMFSKIMNVIQPWYCASERKTKKHSILLVEEGLDRPQDDPREVTNALVDKLKWIGDSLLRQADIKLYAHLEALEIPPQIYGLRWLRLLFGREFPIQDLLFLWDAIFADFDNEEFPLVDFIFIAMLIFIRDLLMGSDYTGCLHYLMRYPPVADVHTLLALSLHLRNPQAFTKPNAYAFMNFSHITVTGRPHPNSLNQREDMLRFDGTNPSGGGPGGGVVAFANSNLAKNLGRTGILTGRVLKSTMNKVGNIVAEGIKDISQPEGSSSGAYGGSVSRSSSGSRMLASSFHPHHHHRPPPSSSAAIIGVGGSANNSPDMSSRRPINRHQQQQNGRTINSSRTPNTIPSASTNNHSHPTNDMESEERTLLLDQVNCLQSRVNDLEQSARNASGSVSEVVEELKRISVVNPRLITKLEQVAEELLIARSPSRSVDSFGGESRRNSNFSDHQRSNYAAVPLPKLGTSNELKDIVSTSPSSNNP